MGRPCKCCGEWFTTQKLEYVNGEIKVRKFTDFFYDHTHYFEGKDEVDPAYGMLQTWDVHPDYEGGVSVFARGAGFVDSLQRFDYVPYGEPGWTNLAGHLRTRRLYDDNLVEQEMPESTPFTFDKRYIGRYTGTADYTRYFPLYDFNGGREGEVCDGDINYKEYRNPNFPIAEDDLTSTDFWTSIQPTNIWVWLKVQNYSVYWYQPYTGGTPIYPHNYVFYGGNDTLYSLFNWENVYNYLFLKYNPTYTTVPSEYSMGSWFSGLTLPSGQVIHEAHGAPRFMNFEFDQESQKIYVVAAMPLAVPEMATLFYNPYDVRQPPRIRPSRSMVYILFEMDCNFNILNYYEYDVEHEVNIEDTHLNNTYATKYIRPNTTFMVPKIKIKNGKVYILHVGRFGEIKDTGGFWLDSFSGGVTPDEYSSFNCGPRRVFDLFVVDLSTGITQPRFTGGVNYTKYSTMLLTNDMSGVTSTGDGITYNHGYAQRLIFPETYIDDARTILYDEEDKQMVLDHAFVVPLASETANYIECHFTELPETVGVNEGWNIDTVVGGYIVGTSSGPSGQAVAGDLSGGINEVTTVNIDFSGGGDVAYIIFSRLLENNIGVPRYIYRAIKYVKDTFFSHLSYPKDFDVDSDGDIYLLMNHDSLTLPWVTSLLESGTETPIEHDFPPSLYYGDAWYYGDYYGFYNAYDHMDDIIRGNTFSGLFASDGILNDTYNNVRTSNMSNVRTPFEIGRTFAYVPEVTTGFNSTRGRVQFAQLLLHGDRKSMIVKNGGVRPDGTEYADVLKISGSTGELLASAVYFNSWLSTGIKHTRLEKYTHSVINGVESNGLRFFYEQFSGVPVNCISVTDDGVWVGGGQVWPSYGTIGDYIPPVWSEIFADPDNISDYLHTYDDDGTGRYRATEIDNEDCYIIPVTQFVEDSDIIPPLETQNRPAYSTQIMVIGSNPTFISPAWNTGAIDITRGDFQWLVGWLDTSAPRTPVIGDTIVNVPYNADASTLPLQDLPMYDHFATGGPAMQQDIYVDGIQSGAVHDAYGVYTTTDNNGDVTWNWAKTKYRTSVSTGVAFGDQYGTFVPATSRSDATPLKAGYPYNLLLFDHDLYVKAKHYFGPSNMSYNRASSAYIMSGFSEIRGMCAVGNDIYVTGDRRHDDIVEASGNKDANAKI